MFLQFLPFLFLSTLSLRRATRTGLICGDGQNISIHALLAESDIADRYEMGIIRISIHALLAESDASNQQERQEQHISIHALLAESDIMYALKLADLVLFLSTLSLRRATALVWCSFGGAFDFYPRSPCGERLGAPVDRMPSSSISIHALLAESDCSASRYLSIPS